jgi:hypothetical protein
MIVQLTEHTITLSLMLSLTLTLSQSLTLTLTLTLILTLTQSERDSLAPYYSGNCTTEIHFLYTGLGRG